MMSISEYTYPTTNYYFLFLTSFYIDHTYFNRIWNDCEEKSTKFLGMHIDENLTWKYQVNEVNKKVARALFPTVNKTSKTCITNIMSQNIILCTNKLSFHIWNINM